MVRNIECKLQKRLSIPRHCKRLMNYYRPIPQCIINLESMPTEILLHIFSYLDPTDLVQSVKPISKRLQDISNSKALWKHFRPSLHIKLSLLAHCILTYGECMRSITLPWSRTSNFALSTIALHCPVLEFLELRPEVENKRYLIHSQPMCQILINCMRLQQIRVPPSECFNSHYKFLSRKFFESLYMKANNGIGKFTYLGSIRPKQLKAFIMSLEAKQLTSKAVIKNIEPNLRVCEIVEFYSNTDEFYGTFCGILGMFIEIEIE